MTINNAYANAAVERTNDFFSISQNDNIAKKGAKATARAIVNTANLVVAAVEMVFSALATAILSPSALTRFNGAVKTTANHTKDSAVAMKNAAKGIVGAGSKKEVEVTVEPKSALTAKNAVAALALTAAAAGVYFFGPSVLSRFTYPDTSFGPAAQFVNSYESAKNVTLSNYQVNALNELARNGLSTSTLANYVA